MELNVSKREIFGKKVKRMRKQGFIPGIIYGKFLDQNIPVFIKKSDFLKIYKEVWESTPIILKGDGINQMVLIHDVDVHPVTDEVIHVDFLAVKADEKVEAEVPVILIWESPVEKNNLWRIELVKDTILVEAYPQDLPHDIKIDISKIQTINDVIHVKDIDLGDKVTIKDNPEETVVTVVEFESEETEEVEKTEWEQLNETPNT